MQFDVVALLDEREYAHLGMSAGRGGDQVAVALGRHEGFGFFQTGRIAVGMVHRAVPFMRAASRAVWRVAERLSTPNDGWGRQRCCLRCVPMTVTTGGTSTLISYFLSHFDPPASTCRLGTNCALRRLPDGGAASHIRGDGTARKRMQSSQPVRGCIV